MQRNRPASAAGGGAEETIQIPDPARLVSLRIENFRVLRRVELRNLTPFTALVGSNGSGKTTVGDAVAFLAECFRTGLCSAWADQGGAEGIRTRGSEGPILFELRYRERESSPVLTYHLEITEERGVPAVSVEWLRWRPRPRGAPVRLLDYRHGAGRAIAGAAPTAEDEPQDLPLSSSDLLAAAALGQFRDHPRIAALRTFLLGWQVPRDATLRPLRSREAEADLAESVHRLSTRRPEQFRCLLDALRRWIPRFRRPESVTGADGHSRVRLEETSFPEPLPARLASGGTAKALALLCRLHDADSARLLALDTPEVSLHPRLLPELAEECRAAAERIQLLVATHSPFFLGGLRPEEVRVLWRNETGTTDTCRAVEVEGVAESVAAGAHLGALWAEGHLDRPFDATRGGPPIPPFAGSRV